LTNDALPSADPIADPNAATGGALRASGRADAPRARNAWLGWLFGIIAALALAAAAYALMQLAQVRKESARRLSDLEQATIRTSEIAARADAEARAARERAALLEARVAEEQSQREALEQLYADLSRGRDEAVLVEVERLVAMAGQELAISGNVGTALAALQTADARLARVESARFVPLRRVIARDVERLKAAPTVDITGIALKLDQLAAGTDSWPLLSDPKALAPSTALPAASDAAGPSPGMPWWERWVERLRTELGDYRDLVRLRQVDTPDALLLAPQQQQLVRLQIRLRLLNARQAVLARNDRLYRADLLEAQAMLTRYVDVRQPAAAAASGLIKQLTATPLSVDVPQINDSIAAVRAARSTPGR
jgi:uroporphyrin-3 C-methyltransferase/uroporphyrinogen III methyltransferase/synthase